MIDGLDSNWVPSRAADLLSRAAGDSTDVKGFIFQSSASSAVGNEMRFTAEHSLRTAFIALASINAVAAAATAAGIFLDCYLQARRRDTGFSLRSSWLTLIGPKETFPYILSLGIAIQGIVFAAAQSLGLGAVLTLGCTQTSRMMLPALFIVPYIQLSFGLETTIRAVARQPFPRSPRWALPICLGAVTVGLVATYAVARAKVPPNFCFAELLWLVQRWAKGTFALLTVIAAVMLIGCILICIRLYRSSGVSETQRTMASWTACYMLLAVITTVMLLPFFWSLYADDTGRIMRYQVRLSMAATIVVNLSGILTGGLYLLLRLTKLGNLGPGGYVEFDGQKPSMGERSSTPGNSIYTKQLAQPVSPVRLEQTRRDLEAGKEGRSEKTSGWPMAFTAQAARPRTPGAAMQIPQISAPDMAFAAGAIPGLRNKDSYNLFPHKRGPAHGKLSDLLPAAAQDLNAISPGQLLPPAPAWKAGHSRNSSLGSSATVQIALRLSNINDMPPGTPSYREPIDSGNGVYRGGPGLAISTDPFDDKASRHSDSVSVDDDLFDFTKALSQKPPRSPATDRTVSDGEITLSPTVYDPKQRAASGLWF